MKMKAAVLRETGAKRPYATSRPIQIEEIEIDPPQAGELLVKIAGGGIMPFRSLSYKRKPSTTNASRFRT